MKFTLTSITGIALATDSLESVTVPTVEGVITILPSHMPLVTALRPGVLEVAYDNKKAKFAIGGGILETNGTELSVIADMVEEGGHDLAEIAKRKEEAEKLMAEYRAKGDQISMEALIDLEQQYLKDIAREQLAQSN
jgi:F-type H+-transporting ATPase subunit epsilon